MRRGALLGFTACPGCNYNGGLREGNIMYLLCLAERGQRKRQAACFLTTILLKNRLPRSLS